MIGLNKWINILKYFGSRYNETTIRNKILSECLDVPKKIYGSWIINSEKVWQNIVLSDPRCQTNFENHRIKCGMDIESWYEERCYSAMRSTYPMRRSRR